MSHGCHDKCTTIPATDGDDKDDDDDDDDDDNESFHFLDWSFAQRFAQS